MTRPKRGEEPMSKALSSMRLYKGDNLETGKKWKVLPLLIVYLVQNGMAVRKRESVRCVEKECMKYVAHTFFCCC